MSGNYTIPEVTVYFDHKLMRGNRTVKVGRNDNVTTLDDTYSPKVSAGDLHAFDSPNLTPLAKVIHSLSLHNESDC